jgi:DNA-binding NtrC family response regulator
MKLYRCAVVRALGAAAASEKVLQALSECSDLEAFFCDQAPSTGSNVCGVVFVFDGTDIDRILRQVRMLRNLMPAVAILAVFSGPHSHPDPDPNPNPEDLRMLLGAGVYDFVSAQGVAGELAVRLKRAIGTMPAMERAPPQRADHLPIRGLVYASDACARVASQIPMMASCDANVLILGETGTGKEVCAQAIHYLSARASRPWIAINCGAIPAELMEAELFGHVKGAYTTAHASRAGLVREAESGTLFLDDIDTLALSSQVKLLRFLQEREYRPVGSNALLRADVRVIAASNCNLNALVQRGTFRQDLYYRLNVLRLDLPALRDRAEDIAVLALHFTRDFARDFRRQVNTVSPCAILKLCAHDWPGNVRELKHVMERAVLLSSGPTLQAHDIQLDCGHHPERRSDSFQSTKSRAVEQFERNYLRRLLIAHDGNISQAAKAAQKDRRAFFELMRKHNLEPQSFRPHDHAARSGGGSLSHPGMG